METSAWLFIVMVAIAVFVLACGEARGHGEVEPDGYDDFVEREIANVGVTATAGIVKTCRSIAKALLRSGNGRRKAVDLMDFDFTSEVANQDDDFWYNPANPQYWVVHNEFTDSLKNPES